MLITIIAIVITAVAVLGWALLRGGYDITR